MLMSDLTPGSYAFQPSAASEESWQPHYYCYYYVNITIHVSLVSTAER